MKEKTKVYIYTRVSTAVQVDGYSLDAQKSRMKAYAEFNDFEIVGEYEDAGKSGKSIEGRLEFNRMMEDIKSGKDGVSYVLVFKLSRFGRNAADVLSTLQVMQDFDVNLICVEDGIDSSKDAGKLMISVLSAVAEIERENIRVQTMEGRIQKAREGKWNGGFAPYGYKLEKGMLYINEEEAEAIRIIFDQYVHTDIGANGLAKYLANHGINKIQRQNGKNPLFDAALIRRILKNPVYCGKIAYGRRRTEKVHGTRNDYRLVEQENYLLVDGLHEAIVSEGLWHEAQVKLLAQAKKYEKVNNGKDNKVHLLTGLLKCPICGAGMYGNKSIKHKPDGTKYKDFFYYGCKHRTMTRGHKCEYKKQINEELLDGAVAEVIIKLVSNPKFAAMMQQKINMKIDTSAIEQEIANYEKQLRQSYATKSRLIDEIDTLDPDDKHYIKRKADLDDRLYKMYDKIEDTENLLIEARAKKMAIEAEKLTADNIYKVLIYFEKLYAVMDEQEKRQIMESLISEIHIYEERQPNGQWLKSIKFKLPIIEEDMEMSLDSDTHVWWDIIRVIKNIRQNKRKIFGNLTLHSKIAIISTLLLIIVGAILVFVLEYDNPQTLKDYTLLQKIEVSFFQSVTTRTAGFATLPQENLTNATAVVCLLLMFIGGSPVGTAGGIKTVTFAVIIASAWASICNKKDTELFGRRLAKQAVGKAVAVTCMSFAIMFVSTVLLSATMDADLLDIAYEAASATATVGLTRNLTTTLNDIGKLIVIITMYLGRVGPISLAVAFNRKKENPNIIRNPIEEISVG